MVCCIESSKVLAFKSVGCIFSSFFCCSLPFFLWIKLSYGAVSARSVLISLTFWLSDFLTFWLRLLVDWQRRTIFVKLVYFLTTYASAPRLTRSLFLTLTFSLITKPAIFDVNFLCLFDLKVVQIWRSVEIRTYTPFLSSIRLLVVEKRAIEFPVNFEILFDF